MTTFISCNLMGGLGNQLFQIFTTIAYGIQTKRKIVFPYSESLHTGIERLTYWHSFLHSLRMMTTFNPSHGVTNLLFCRYSFIGEKGFSYEAVPEYSFREIVFNGYFQSYKYFEHYKDSIFGLIRLEQQKDDIRKEFPAIHFPNTISMHFRLGDYVNIQDCHPLMPYEYYKNALQYIVEHQKDQSFTVLYFCQEQDNETVLNMIRRLQDVYPSIVFTKVDDKVPDWKQMLLMSCCQHNIIANSTFSWWGGYFNQNLGKMVCYPDKWFGPKINHDTRDLFPGDWISVATEKA